MKQVSFVILFYTICALVTIFVLIFINTTESNQETVVNVFTTLNISSYNLDILRLTKCMEVDNNLSINQRNNYFVLLNYVKASRKFACYESITYTTQADFVFLDNVPILVERWNGPISLTIYAPGDDFHSALKSIAFLRNCETPLIKEYVTFHIVLLSGHFPEIKSSDILHLYQDKYNCMESPPFKTILPYDTYRRRNNLSYPINLSRNVARQAATTHFVFASDIELYPSQNFIEKFMKMIVEKSSGYKNPNPKVYVLPIFEILAKAEVPNNKTELQKMLKAKTAFLFHEKLCRKCHVIPKYDKWIAQKESDNLHVFTIAKRTDKHKKWEAFYIGTKEDPIFEERQSWEGEMDKMVQAYAMCLLNYDYMVLDNAFLIHKPGIKKSKEQPKYKEFAEETNDLISNYVLKEFGKIYGFKEECVV